MAKRPTASTALRQRRHRRVRMRITGTSIRPRFSVFRSGKHMVVQVIDDQNGKTLAAASDRDVSSNRTDAAPGDADGTQRKVVIARAIGRVLAERARAQQITAVVFDRGGYAYHGRVRAVAEGAREGGLEF